MSNDSAAAILSGQDGSVLYDDPHPLRRLLSKTTDTDDPGSATPQDAADQRARKLTKGERAAVVASALGAVALGLVGLLMSFSTVRATAAGVGIPRPWLVPLAIDLGVAVFSAIDLVMARLQMRLRWLRLFVWGLVGSMIYLNVAKAAGLVATVIHITLPTLWVVVVEIAAHALQVRAGLAAGEDVYDRIPLWRWLLAPVPTLMLWRRTKLWRIERYSDAVAWEQRRRLTRARLRDLYGRGWRRSVPRAVVEHYRLGQWDALDREIYHRRLLSAQLCDQHGDNWTQMVPRAITELYQLGEWHELHTSLDVHHHPNGTGQSEAPVEPAEADNHLAPVASTSPAPSASPSLVTVAVPDAPTASVTAEARPEEKPVAASGGADPDVSLTAAIAEVYNAMVARSQRPTRDAVAREVRRRGYTAPNGVVSQQLRELRNRE